MNLRAESLTLEVGESNEHGPCDCCGNESRTVWGYIYRNDSAYAAYYVHWTVVRPDHGQTVYLLVGDWGDAAKPDDRKLVMLEGQYIDGLPTFMIVDADAAPANMQQLSSGVLNRDQIIGTEFAQAVFGIIDVIWLKDPRVPQSSVT